VNARRSPGWILGNHAEDQGPNLFARMLSASPLSSPGEPFPIQPKACLMPTNHRSRRNQDERPFPSSPEPSQHDPEQLVQRSKSMARSFGVQSQQLLAKSQIFEDEIFSGTECTDKPSQKVPKRNEHSRNHGLNLIGTPASSSFQLIHSASARGFDERPLPTTISAQHCGSARLLVPWIFAGLNDSLRSKRPINTSVLHEHRV
jgi:hypothetical protein